MKNFSYALNALFAVLIGILFYLHFYPSNAQNAQPQPVLTKTADGKVQAQAQVVYINTDTLFEKYNYYKSLKKQLENQNKAAETALDTRTKNFQGKMFNYQTRVKDAQQKLESNQLNEIEAIKLQKEFAEVEKTLAQEEQDILKYREKLTKDLLDKEEKLQKQLKTKIDDYLKKISLARGYSYVLAYSAASSVLYGNSGLDITNEVVKQLNENK